MAANSNSVFGTAKPLEGNVSDWVNNQEQTDFAYRAEQREVAKIAQDQKDKEQADYEKRLEKFQMPTIDPTKVRSVDEINTLVLLKAKDQQLDIWKELKPGISNDKYAELLMRQKNLDNLPNYLRLANQAFVSNAEAIQKDLSEGKIKFTPDLQKKLTSFSDGNFAVELDDNGMPMLGLWDKDGDGKPDILPYDKIIGQQIFGEQIPNLNFTSSFQTIGEKLGSVKTGTDRNFTERTIKETPIDLARKTAKASLYDDKGNLTSIAKSKLYDMGYSDFKNVPEKALDDLENQAVEIMMATRDKEDITKVDNGARNTANENARKAKDDKKPTWGIVTTPPIYSAAGFDSAKGYQTVAVQGKVSIPALQFREGKKNKTITNGQVQSYTVKKNSFGQRYIVAEIVYQDEKSKRIKDAGSSTDANSFLSDSSETTTIGESKLTQVVPLTETQAKIFAQQLGFKNVNEMKDAAKNGSEPYSVQGIGSKY